MGSWHFNCASIRGRSSGKVAEVQIVWSFSTNIPSRIFFNWCLIWVNFSLIDYRKQIYVRSKWAINPFIKSFTESNWSASSRTRISVLEIPNDPRWVGEETNKWAFIRAYFSRCLTHILKEQNVGFILTIHVKVIWPTFTLCSSPDKYQNPGFPYLFPEKICSRGWGEKLLMQD